MASPHEGQGERPVAMVTGAAARIGAAIVRQLHRGGYDILLHFNQSQEAALALAMELNTRREHSVHALQADLQDLDQLRKLAADCLSHFGRLDVLVNNASCFYPTPLKKATENDWNALMGCNARGPFFLARELADALAQRAGCMVNIADIHARSGLEGYSLYSMSKAALTTMTRALAKELAPAVRVNGVSPGAILWPQGEGEILDEDRKREILAEISLGRTGDPADIAHAVLFLIEQADYITGEIITVDGGRSLSTG